MEPEDVVAEADWVGIEPEGPEELWREHLRRQLHRTLVAALIVLGLMGLRGAGRPGQWLLGRIARATRADFSAYLAGVFEEADLRGLARTVRSWLARELQVTGPGPRRQSGPPALQWPVRNGRLMSNNSRATAGLGLDLQAPAGSEVLAAAGGVVAEARQERDGSMTIALQHEEGWRTVYGRCVGLLVGVGEKVVPGQPIGLVGTAPPPTPAHLHFEVWDRSGPVDPYPYLEPAAAGNGSL